MMSLRLVAVLSIVIGVSLSADARRRSRVDSPIQPAADAPLEDNLATASGSEPVFEKIESPPPEAKESSEEKKVAEPKEISKPAVECADANNLSFELITGYVNK